MIDMKLTPEQAQQMTSLATGEGENIEIVGAYPEGLKLEFEGETLRRLAIGSGNLPPVGAKYMLHAIVEIVEVSKEEGAMDTEYCVEAQIQQMELADAQNEQQRAMAQINKMYG